MPSGPAIEVVDLTVRYGERLAVDALTFSAGTGAVTALLGPNGAGKTSTVETLEGYRHPTAGSVRVLGLDPIADHRRLVGRIGVMLQSGGIQTGIRPLEALRLYASYYDDPVDPREMLDLVGLTGLERSTWKSMSGGEQQRLSLALALIGRPDVVFLDEPTAGVDPNGRLIIRRIIGDLRDRGVSVLLTTHDLDEAERLADHVLIIDRGRVLAEGTPADLMAGADDEILFGAPPSLDTVALGSAIGATVTERTPGEYHVATSATPSMVAAITAWLAEHDLPLADLRAGRQRLEDVFVRLTAESSADEPVETAASRGRSRRSRR